MKITVQVHIGFLQGTVMQRFVGKSLVESFFSNARNLQSTTSSFVECVESAN